MKLFEQRIIGNIEGEEIELYILDKYRAHTNNSNMDVYLCRDKKGDAYIIYPENILRFV